MQVYRPTAKENEDFNNVFFKDLLFEILEYIVDNFSPEEVFGITTLEDWALDAGFVIPDDVPEESIMY